MNHRRPRTLTLMTLLTIATAMLTTAVAPHRGTVTVPEPFTNAPVLALEYVQSAEQFTAITQQPIASDRGDNSPASWASARYWHAAAADLTLIAAYGFLWLWLLKFAGGRRRRLTVGVGVSAIVIAVAADCVEDWGIIHGLHSAVAPADVIRLSATIKWFALGIVFLALVERFLTTPVPVSAPRPTMTGARHVGWIWTHRLIGIAYLAGGALALYASVRRPDLLTIVTALIGVALLLQAPLFAVAIRYDVESIDRTGYTEDIAIVREKELEYIARRRWLRSGGNPKERVGDTLVGIALSGGGIRSATTNLGVLQALAHMRLLPHIDYLSTVSGGGYIGSCLSTLLSINNSTPPGSRQQYQFESRRDLKFNTRWRNFPFNPEVAAHGSRAGTRRAGESVGNRIVAHLRTHGNFLIARRGLLKRDALRAVGQLLTGAVYHIVTTVLVLFVSSLLLMGLAHLIEPDLQKVLERPVTPEAATLAAVTGGPTPTSNAFVVTQPQPVTWQREFSERFSRMWVDVQVDVTDADLVRPLIAGAGATVLIFVLFYVATRLPPWPARWGAGESREDRFDTILLHSVVIVLLVSMALICWFIRERTPDGRSGYLLEPFLVMAGARVMNVVLYPLIGRADYPRRPLIDLWTRQFRSLWTSYQALTTYGMAVTFLFACLPVMAYAAAHVSFWSLVAPALSLLGGRLLTTAAAGRMAGRLRIPGAVVRFLLGAAVLLFLGFVMLESAALAVYFGFDSPLVDHGHRFMIALGIGGAVTLFLGLVGDINKISPHYFYRDRLLETYFRTEFAALDKRMVTFTNMMEMPLRKLHGEATTNTRLGNTAPYMLISASINLPGSRDLTRKDRKSGYFLFSKYYCGSRHTGYRRTNYWRGGQTKLSRAITISGAAVSPAMGAHTFFAEAFFTVLFNARLGFWMSSPRSNAGDRLVFWPRYMLQEVLSTANERTPLVNLSDGGHTGDNIGIYPLLERRCQVIIACDAEADGGLSFGSFTEALRHAYVDMGIDVDIDLSMIRPDPVTKLSKSHCAIGRIRYPECPDRPNWLIYLKNSLTGDEPAPVMNYRMTCPDFPHESTADQFFDDAQFESYRALGSHIAEETFAAWAGDPRVMAALLETQR